MDLTKALQEAVEDAVRHAATSVVGDLVQYPRLMSAVKAALVAAVAQAPVVQPRRNGPSGLRVMALF